MAEPSGGGVTPTAIPETTPPQRYPMTDYSFTLQAVMELQKAVGGLTVRIDELIGKVDKQADRLNSISHQIYAAWAVLIVFGALGGFVISHLWAPMVKLFIFSLKLPN
jgi:hypothetical protein